jgi:hypothetical protein
MPDGQVTRARRTVTGNATSGEEVHAMTGLAPHTTGGASGNFEADRDKAAVHAAWSDTTLGRLARSNVSTTRRTYSG